MNRSKTLVKYTVLFLLPCLALSSYILKANVVDIATEQEFEHLIKKNTPIILQFAADWCGACQGAQEPFKQISEEAEFKNITFAHVNVEKLQEVSKKYGVSGIPTFVYIENGSPKKKEVGYKDIASFKDTTRNNLRTLFSMKQSTKTTTTVDETTNPITGTHTISKEVTSEHINPKKNEDTVIVKKETLSQTPPAGDEGVMAKILTFLSNIFVFIKNVIAGIFNWIKGIFGK